MPGPDPLGEAKEAALTAVAWTPVSALSPCTTHRLQQWGHSWRWKQGAAIVELGVRGEWNLAAREKAASCGRLRLKLAAGIQTELAAQRCQSWDFHGQFLLQDTWWGWISQYIGEE